MKGPLARVIWNAEKLAILRKGLSDAGATRAQSFDIRVKPEGRLTLIPAYARYLIEYVQDQIDANPPTPRGPDNEGREGQ